MSNMTYVPLSSWMVVQPERTISIGKPLSMPSHMSLSTKVLVERVAQWHATLLCVDGNRYAVYETDPIEFLCICLALWQLGRIACVLGDNRQATVDACPHVFDHFIGEFPNAVTPSDDCKHINVDNIIWQAIPPKQVVLEIYTSGSTGTPKAIGKTIADIDEELHCLKKQWVPRADSVVLSTVSHQHLYGLTFWLFRPFCAGQIIYASLCEYTEELLLAAKDHDAVVFVSSPSHISRINNVLDWSTINCLNVFSAAAPLKKSDAINMTTLVNAPVWEVYGSSETGVIAWRQQDLSTNSNAAWSCLPSVSIVQNDEQSWEVNSPFSSDLVNVLSDELYMYDNGQFDLRGRRDQIVKIEGKRVSLNTIENALLKDARVSDIKALVVSSRRTEVAIVLVLSELGKEHMMAFGRKNLVSSFKHILTAYVDKIALPRKWRFVDSLPVNKQGKLPLASLEKIVSEPIFAEWPNVIDVSQTDNDVLVKSTIPSNLIYFDGHFEGSPILPGVAQLHWAHKWARYYFNISSKFLRLEVIKFSKVIQPNELIDIQLSFDSAKNKVTFNYRSAKGLHASGRICFE